MSNPRFSPIARFVAEGLTYSLIRGDKADGSYFYELAVFGGAETPIELFGSEREAWKRLDDLLPYNASATDADGGVTLVKADTRKRVIRAAGHSSQDAGTLAFNRWFVKANRDASIAFDGGAKYRTLVSAFGLL